MILLAGLLFWGLALAALARLLLPHRRVPRARVSAGWAALFLLCALVLLRPHEDILGGEDPGSYLNAAVSFHRHGALFHTDPMLSQLPENDHAAFLYGHAGFGRTKDACLWIRGPGGLVGPWFQPSYPVMAGVLSRISPRGVLYGAPLLGLMTALVLAILAARLTGRPLAAPLAFAVYCLSPVVAWNARAPRAEMGAVFFLWAAWALLLSTRENDGKAAWLDTGLALLCLSIAPLFHITASYPVIATFAVLLGVALRGHGKYLLALPAALLSFALMAFQAYRMTDCYGTRRWFDFVFAHPWMFGGTAVAAGTVFAAIVWHNRDRPAGGNTPASHGLTVPAILTAVVVPLLVLAIALLRDDLGRVPLLPGSAVRHFILTDIQGLVRLYSLPLMAVALAGWVLVALRSPAHPGPFPPWLFLAAMTPGILMTGWMNNYMMETRRMMIVPAPMITLCIATVLAAVAGRIQGFHRRLAGPAISVLLCLAVTGAMVLPKAILYRTTEYRGFFRFLKPYAAEVRRHNGILLAEYSRIAAPFEHFFGIPLLALDSDRRTDYRQAEQSWSTLMRRNPGRSFFFLSPYSRPVSAWFDFEPVMEHRYTGEKLSGSRRSIPAAPRPFDITLRLFRMTLKTPGRDLSPQVFERSFDGGNMGLRDFANLLVKPRLMRGYRVPPDRALRLEFAPPGRATTLLLFVHSSSRSLPAKCEATFNLPASRQSASSSKAVISWEPLIEGWFVGSCPGMPAESDAMELRSQGGDIHLGNVLAIQGGSILPLSFTTATVPTVLAEPQAVARWARHGASMLLPVPRGASAMAYCLVALDRGQPATAAWLESGASGDGAETILRQEGRLTPGEWTWRAIPLTGDDANLTRLAFRAEQPWAPARKGFPADLAVIVGAVVSRPLPPPDDDAP